MSSPKAIFVVGHSNWGKSATLRALTDGSHRVRRIRVSGVEFFIRRMSNDDQPESFINLMMSVRPEIWPNILAALCPDFDDPEKKTGEILRALHSRGYKLFFWVLHGQYGTGELIKLSEISHLRKFGKVEIFSEVAEASRRGKEFKSFVQSIVNL